MAAKGKEATNLEVTGSSGRRRGAAASQAAGPARPAAEAPPGRAASRYLRYGFVLVLAATVGLLWVSLASFSPTDWPSTLIHPPKRAVDNAAGTVGAYVAHALLYWLGGGVYMAVLFATVAAGLLLLGGRLNDLPWRIVGVLLLVAATSAAIYLRDPACGAYPHNGSAGVLGAGLGQFLLAKFHGFSWLIVGVTACIGLVFAAENVVLQIVRLGRKVLRRGRAPAGAFAADPVNRDAFDEPVAPQARVRASPQVAPAGPRVVPPALRPKPRLPVPKPAHGKAGAPKSQPPESKEYELPSADLLKEPAGEYIETAEMQAEQKQAILQQTLNDFNVDAQVVGYMTGPVITLFELTVSPGVKVSQIGNLATDIARALAVPGVRVVSPLPGKDTIGIEVPNLDKEIVRIKELMRMAAGADERMFLPLYLGKDAGGAPIVADLARMPHLLIAGTTGSGKSVCLNSIIMSILLKRTPETVRLILLDPKMVEMAAFDGIPHLLCPIVNDMRKAEAILEWAATKMDERYELLKEAGVKNIAGYNELSEEEIYRRLEAESDEERARIAPRLAYYVIVVDELADLMMTSGKEVEGHIIRIAQKARAVGIHLVLSTQRPSVNVVTGLIKSNMPCRVSFRVASRQESRIVLDQNGADVLLGQGDMLFLQPGTSSLIRAQGAYVDEAEIRRVVVELRKVGDPQFNQELVRLNARPGSDGDGERDELFDKAIEIVLTSRRGSVSLLQRRLQVGYSRASRIIDQMADAGILGDYKGSQARECLLNIEDWQAMQESATADQSGESALNGQPTSA